MKDTVIVPFIEPIFKGNRFVNHRLPVLVLPDVTAYDTLVRAIAKELYLSSNKERKRLPRGFQERFKLNLTEIKSGSVVSVLSREYDSEPKSQDEFDHARDLLNQFISSVNNQKPLETFPKKIIYLFEALGQTLHSDETIELRIPGKSSCVYSKETRSKILSISKKPYLEICYFTGSISGFDAEKRKLFVVLDDGQAIEGPLDQSFDSLLREIAPHYKKKDIAVTLIGLAKYHPDGTIAEIKKLQHLIVFQEGIPRFFPDLHKQFAELKKLDDGWKDGEGKSFSASDLTSIKTWLEDLLKPGDLPVPFIYPADPGIECEWSFGHWEVSLTYSIADRIVLIHAAHVNSQEVREDRYSIENTESIEKTRRFLQNLLDPLN